MFTTLPRLPSWINGALSLLRWLHRSLASDLPKFLFSVSSVSLFSCLYAPMLWLCLSFSYIRRCSLWSMQCAIYCLLYFVFYVNSLYLFSRSWCLHYYKVNTPWLSSPNKADLPSVHPSTNRLFLNLMKYVVWIEVNECYTTVSHVTRSKVKFKVTDHQS